MNTEPKVWNTDLAHKQIHVFLNGRAKCGSNAKQGRSPMHTRSDGVIFVEDTKGLTFCESCEKAFIAAEKRMATKRAKMIAKTGVPFTPVTTFQLMPRVVRPVVPASRRTA